MTRAELAHLAELLEDFIGWLGADDEPTLDTAPLRWVLYLVNTEALLQRDLAP